MMGHGGEIRIISSQTIINGLLLMALGVDGGGGGGKQKQKKKSGGSCSSAGGKLLARKKGGKWDTSSQDERWDAEQLQQQEI